LGGKLGDSQWNNPHGATLALAWFLDSDFAKGLTERVLFIGT
jgi:hypothetical protein